MYLVSFATLMMMVVGTVQVLQGVVSIGYPNPQPGPMASEIRMRYADMAQKDSKITEAEVKKQVENERAQAIKNQRYYDVRSLINNIVLFGVALPVYLYHWRKIQQSEE